MIFTKRLSGLFVAVCVTGSMILVAGTAKAVENPATAVQLDQIRSRCSEIQATLSRVHANDALLRVNRGQLYERLSTKLTVPFNSRIALNRLDGSTLLTVTSSYEQHLNQFREQYQAYEEQLSTTMRTSCTKQPAKFYDNLQSARVKRETVRESTLRLAKDIADYKQAFTAFAKPYREKN